MPFSLHPSFPERAADKNNPVFMYLYVQSFLLFTDLPVLEILLSEIIYDTNISYFFYFSNYFVSLSLIRRRHSARLTAQFKENRENKDIFKIWFTTKTSPREKSQGYT